MEKHQYLLNSLQDWLHERGFADAGNSRPGLSKLEPDLVLQKGHRLMVAEAKVANIYRSQVFPALIGDFILRAGESINDDDIMIALLVKRLSDKALADLASYADIYLPELNWFLLDEDGAGRASISGSVSDLSFDPLPSGSHSRPHGAPKRALFSLNNQWLLKMLLLPGIHPRYWGGPREQPRSIVKLAQAANVPQSSVSAFVSKFEAEGYIRREKGRPVVVRHRELLDEWFFAARNASSERIPVKHMYGDSPEDLCRRIGIPDIAQGKLPDMIVGYHLACHLHEVGRSNVKVGWLYPCRQVEDLMKDYELVADKSSSPRLWLVPEKAKVVGRGWVEAGGIPACDILQCYLDVRESHARGHEQADHILNQVLMPHFERRA